MFGTGLGWIFSWAAGLVYPIYMSFKALQSVGTADDVQWLTYWIVYGSVQTLEGPLLWLLLWIPFYYELKFLFILWLVMPQTKGAEYLYEHHFKPFLMAYGSKLDPVFGIAEKALSNEQLGQLVKLAEKHGPGLVQKAVSQAIAEVQKLAAQVPQ